MEYRRWAKGGYSNLHGMPRCPRFAPALLAHLRLRSPLRVARTVMALRKFPNQLESRSP